MNQERLSLTSLSAALADAVGIAPPAEAAPAARPLTDFVNAAFGGARADRLFMYNPDAIAQWIAEKYAPFVKEAVEIAPLAIPFETVMPSVTPVCFGTMYTGALPHVHGIRKYEKPIITTDSLFDAMIRAGKRPAIVAETNSSMAKIYLGRDMDYYIYDTIAEVNAKACQLILEDRHDMIAVYNGNYDALMHKNGTEAPIALGELRANVHAFAQFAAMIRTHWTNHRTLIGFAMDHGCHDIDGGCGSHGLDMEEDLHIVHYYGTL